MLRTRSGPKSSLSIRLLAVLYYPGQKKEPSSRFAARRTLFPVWYHARSGAISAGQKLPTVADRTCPPLMAPDRAWYHTWNRVLFAANLDYGSFFLSRVVDWIPGNLVPDVLGLVLTFTEGVRVLYAIELLALFNYRPLAGILYQTLPGYYYQPVVGTNYQPTAEGNFPQTGVGTDPQMAKENYPPIEAESSSNFGKNVEPNCGQTDQTNSTSVSHSCPIDQQPQAEQSWPMEQQPQAEQSWPMEQQPQAEQSCPIEQQPQAEQSCSMEQQLQADAQNMGEENLSSIAVTKRKIHVRCGKRQDTISDKRGVHNSRLTRHNRCS